MIKLTVEEQRLITTTLTYAEVRIKQITVDGTLRGWSKKQMEVSTRKVIEESIKKFPANFPKLDEIRTGLYYSRRLWRDQFEKSLLPTYLATINALVNAVPDSKLAIRYKAKGMSAVTPYELFKEIDAYGPKYSQRGYISIKNYPNEVRKYIKRTAETPLSELPSTSKRRMSLMAKAELDLRFEKQTNMIQAKIDSGKLLQWISTHADCSERCEPDQGKLVHMTLSPINSKMETGLIEEGNIVYSFKGITEKVDKWGWKNNIIVGPNCRHDLHDYKPGTRPPHFYEEGQVAKERAINENMRKMERKIRSIRKDAILMKDIDKIEARALKKKASALFDEYDKYARTNGFSVQEWRCQIQFYN
jgi:Phage minor capsid protein 2.